MGKSRYLTLDISLLELNKVIEEASRGDNRAQYKLYQLFYTDMFPTCRRYRYDDEEARDILNQSFLKVMNNLKKFDLESSFQAWCRRITINTILDDLRKKGRNKEALIESYDEFLGRTKNDTLEKINEDNILRLLDYLPPASKNVFNLYAIEGYNHKEIAEKLNITSETSRWHLKNARVKLKELLEKLNVLENK